jgi:hypothetical protein
MAMTPAEKKQRAEDRATQQWHARAYGPQVPGGAYRNGYWGTEYTVEAMWSDRAGGWQHAPFIRCRDADGAVREHCTPWDYHPVNGDRVVRQPPGAVPLRDLLPARGRDGTRSR